MLLLHFVVLLTLIATSFGGHVPRWSPLGIVEGITDCNSGPGGELRRVEITDCTNVPCHFIPNNYYDIVIRYTSGVTSDNLHLIIYLSFPGINFELLDLPINGNVEAGIEYELTFGIPVGTEFSDGAYDLYMNILDAETHKIEICARAPITIA